MTIFVVSPADAACTSPAGTESAIIYNGDYHTYQFCNGTSWIPYQAGYSWGQQSTYNPTIPPGSGFFVLTKTTWNGNLGGRSGADSKCLTEIGTTNTGWKGYATANGNGQLVAGKVFAFVCDGSTCTNLTASTIYYFANAGNGAAGGASFTTDSSGFGPGDSANWSAANYFGGTYTYWTNSLAGGTGTLWPGTGQGGGNGALTCNNFTQGTSGSTVTGSSGNTGTLRWSGGNSACTSANYLICFVNP